MAKKEVIIIMPAYNEGKNIYPVLQSLKQRRITDFADVLVINDASTDNTPRIVDSFEECIMISHVYNLGYGSALQVGYKYAVKHGYKYLIQMDSDGQHDICNIEKILEKLKERDSEGKCPDIVLGARYMAGSGEFKVSALKKIAYGLFRGMIRMFTGRRIADPTTGLQGLSRRAFEYYSKCNQFDFKYPDANMILQMLLLGFRVEEIPAVMHQRSSGVSMHSGLKPVIYMFRMTFSIFAVAYRIKVVEKGKKIDEK